LTYTCISHLGKRKTVWQGEIRMLSMSDNTYEVEITGRGTYFHVIVGEHQYGNYICIPNHEVGCELATYSDMFWNTECLSKHLQEIDAVTVACGLSHLSEL
jgi:hypothetical protein